MKEMTLSWALKEVADLTGREGSVEEGLFRRKQTAKAKVWGPGYPTEAVGYFRSTLGEIRQPR